LGLLDLTAEGAQRGLKEEGAPPPLWWSSGEEGEGRARGRREMGTSSRKRGS